MINTIDLIENLPEDLIGVLLETLYKTSKISIVVLSHVNKFCYRIARRCAICHGINHRVHPLDIVAEGSLEVLKWIDSFGFRLIEYHNSAHRE